jgi:hypothetical protein
MDGADDNNLGLPLSAYCYIPLWLPVSCINQCKVLVSNECNHMVITTHIHLARKAR